jgi:hypothetical protein
MGGRGATSNRRGILLSMAARLIILTCFLALVSQADEKKPKLDPSTVHGRIQFVQSFPDYKVKAVKSFADLKVKIVKSQPDAGEWMIVETFPDYKIQMVETFPDFTVEFTNGLPEQAK